ncbi:MAG TPA: hypothetical protein VN848_07435 [Gemmatimonadales bacterium]|nr:hypothetical protein [Gemmatimonadales bacterium]
MTPEELDPEILKLERQLDEQRTRLEATAQVFIAAAGRHVQSLLPQVMEQIVTRRHERAKALGSEALRELKTKLADLVERAPVLVGEALAESAHWVHRAAAPGAVEPFAYDPKYRHTDSFREMSVGALQWQLRQVVSEVGILAGTHGFDLGNDPDWPPRHPAGHGLQPLYSNQGLGWSTDMIAAIDRYRKALIPFSTTCLALSDLRERKAQLEAKRLWHES